MNKKKLLSLIISLSTIFVVGLTACLVVFLPKNTKADDFNQEFDKHESMEINLDGSYTGAYVASNSKKGGSIFLEPGAKFTLDGGVVGGYDNRYGGAIYVSSGATFTMTGGVITDCSARFGGAIYVEAGGNCNITGGEIRNCSAENGYAVYLEEGANLNGATVSKSTSTTKVSTDIIKSTNRHAIYDYTINYLVDGAMIKTESLSKSEVNNWAVTFSSSEAPLDEEHCVGWFSGENENENLSTSVDDGSQIALNTNGDIYIWTKSVSNLSKLQFIYVSKDNAYKVAAANRNISGEVVVPKKYNGRTVYKVAGATHQPDWTGDSKTKYVGGFAGCTAVTKYYLPDTIKEIEGFAFHSTTVKEFHIPKGVQAIGDSVFTDNYLEAITVSKENTTFEDRNSNAIIEKETDKLIYGCANTVIPASVKSLGDSAFRACFNLTSITIPESSGITEIPYRCFYFCINLETIKFSSKITKMGDYSFYNCYNKLIEITLPESLETIGLSAFYGNVKLESVTFNSNLKEIGYGAFFNCLKLKTLSNFESLTKLETIGQSSFQSCSSIEELVLPSGVIRIKKNAFKDAGLTKIYIPDSIGSLSEKIFENTLSTVNTVIYVEKTESELISETTLLSNWAYNDYSQKDFDIIYGANMLAYNNDAFMLKIYEVEGENFEHGKTLKQTYLSNRYNVDNSQLTLNDFSNGETEENIVINASEINSSEFKLWGNDNGETLSGENPLTTNIEIGCYFDDTYTLYIGIGGIYTFPARAIISISGTSLVVSVDGEEKHSELASAAWSLEDGSYVLKDIANEDKIYRLYALFEMVIYDSSGTEITRLLLEEHDSIKVDNGSLIVSGVVENITISGTSTTLWEDESGFTLENNYSYDAVAIGSVLYRKESALKQYALLVEDEWVDVSEIATITVRESDNKLTIKDTNLEVEFDLKEGAFYWGSTYPDLGMTLESGVNYSPQELTNENNIGEILPLYAVNIIRVSGEARTVYIAPNVVIGGTISLENILVHDYLTQEDVTITLAENCYWVDGNNNQILLKSYDAVDYTVGTIKEVYKLKVDNVVNGTLVEGFAFYQSPEQLSVSSDGLTIYVGDLQKTFTASSGGCWLDNNGNVLKKNSSYMIEELGGRVYVTELGELEVETLTTTQTIYHLPHEQLSVSLDGLTISVGDSNKEFTVQSGYCWMSGNGDILTANTSCRIEELGGRVYVTYMTNEETYYVQFNVHESDSDTILGSYKTYQEVGQDVTLYFEIIDNTTLRIDSSSEGCIIEIRNVESYAVYQGGERNGSGSEVTQQNGQATLGFCGEYTQIFVYIEYVTQSEEDVYKDANGYVYADNTEKTLVGYDGNLTDIVIPYGVTSVQINNEYFSAETGAQITTISIHDSVTYISSSSFSRCSNLKSIYIPSGVNGINSGHFSSEVSRLIVYSDDYSIPSSWVLPSTYRIVCTSSLTEHYDAISFIKENPDLIYRGTTVVGAFDTSLTSIEIPSGIKFIGSHVFRDCYNLTKVTIPGSVITIKENAFFSHDNLTEVIIENYALTTIGDSAFESCEKLQSISKLPSTLTNVGNNAFAGCSSLGSVDMSETQVKTLGVGVFANCSALTTVELPTGLTSIPAMTFANSGLTSLDISTTSVTVIEIYAFYGCSSLTAIKLPTNVTCNYEIEPEGGSQWTEDQLESHLVSIGLGAFIGGVSGGVSGAVLGAIVAGVITAFNNNSNTTSSDRTVMTAFTGCSNLTIYTSKSSGTWCAKGETIGEGYCAISAYNSYPNQ